jgi:anti-sigma regulatory factor (Ser/Thr protein kinase)
MSTHHERTPAAADTGTGPSPQERLLIRPGLRDLPLIYPWFESVATRLGLHEKEGFRIHIALEEAVSNAARHGFPPDADAWIEIGVTVEATHVIVTIIDQGTPFDPLSAPPPTKYTSLDDVVPGGLGISLMRKFTTAMRYARVGESNRLTMVFDR